VSVRADWPVIGHTRVTRISTETTTIPVRRRPDGDVVADVTEAVVWERASASYTYDPPVES
jgi:hypothetical protein